MMQDVNTLPRRPSTLRASAEVDATLTSARQEVIILSTLRTGLHGANAVLRRVDHDNLRRGVRYRVLFPDGVRTHQALATVLSGLTLAGANVRTAPEIPLNARVIDGELALLPGEPDEEHPAGVTLLRLPGAVRAITELFERIWPSSVPLLASDVASDADLSPREQDLLALLAAGWTDESAAARLGISVRTVRRTMSDIMRRLGARSRFQAGVKAVGQGWRIEAGRP